MPCMYELRWKYVNSVVVVRCHFLNKSKNINPSTVILLIRTTVITTFNYGLVQSIVWSTTVKQHWGLLRLVWPNLNARGAVCKNRTHVHFVFKHITRYSFVEFSRLICPVKNFIMEVNFAAVLLIHVLVFHTSDWQSSSWSYLFRNCVHCKTLSSL